MPSENVTSLGWTSANQAKLKKERNNATQTLTKSKSTKSHKKTTRTTKTEYNWKMIPNISKTLQHQPHHQQNTEVCLQRSLNAEPKASFHSCFIGIDTILTQTKPFGTPCKFLNANGLGWSASELVCKKLSLLALVPASQLVSTEQAPQWSQQPSLLQSSLRHWQQTYLRNAGDGYRYPSLCVHLGTLDSQSQ